MSENSAPKVMNSSMLKAMHSLNINHKEITATVHRIFDPTNSKQKITAKEALLCLDLMPLLICLEEICLALIFNLRYLCAYKSFCFQRSRFVLQALQFEKRAEHRTHPSLTRRYKSTSLRLTHDTTKIPQSSPIPTSDQPSNPLQLSCYIRMDLSDVHAHIYLYIVSIHTSYTFEVSPNAGTDRNPTSFLPFNLRPTAFTFTPSSLYFLGDTIRHCFYIKFFLPHFIHSSGHLSSGVFS